MASYKLVSCKWTQTCANSSPGHCLSVCDPSLSVFRRRSREWREAGLGLRLLLARRPGEAGVSSLVLAPGLGRGLELSAGAAAHQRGQGVPWSRPGPAPRPRPPWTPGGAARHQEIPMQDVSPGEREQRGASTRHNWPKPDIFHISQPDDFNHPGCLLRPDSFHKT